jgi:hypothetical protein
MLLCNHPSPPLCVVHGILYMNVSRLPVVMSFQTLGSVALSSQKQRH